MSLFNITDLRTMTDQLNKWTQAYDIGKPEVSDEEWDNLYFKLLAAEKVAGYSLPNSPTQKINYAVVSELKKKKHNHLMLSLDKTKNIEDIKNFFSIEQEVIEMCKMDGLTCSIEYKNGKLISAETRGDGEVGEDILHNALVIPSIPNRINYKDDLIIDGEIISTYNNFKSFDNEYKNPRNFAAGSIRLLDSKECSRRGLTFVAWDVIKGFEEIDSLKESLFKLKNLGFTIVPKTVTSDYNEAIEYLKNKAHKKSYPIDGIVFKYDSRFIRESLGHTRHHFRNALAYKFYDETYKTKIHKIEWTMGRTGVLTPVAVFEPIDIDGTMVERASLHNLSILKELGLHYQFQEIEVFKANQIIPQVAKAYPYSNDLASVKGMEIPDICPICGGKTEIVHTDTSIVLKCTNPNCAGKLVNHLDHFCGKKGLDIKGLSKNTLEKLINWNWVKSIYDIYNLKDYRNEWILKSGFGEKSVDKILLAIEESKNAELANFISAIGIPEIGLNTSKVLVEYFNTWGDFRQAVDDVEYHFWELPNFGTEMNSFIKGFNYEEADKLVNIIHLNNTKVETIGNKLQGLTIVITGKLKEFKNRNELKAEIEANGGKVSGSITGNTNYLINNDTESSSSKNKAAKEKNIPIISEKDFIKNFLTK